MYTYAFAAAGLLPGVLYVPGYCLLPADLLGPGCLGTESACEFLSSFQLHFVPAFQTSPLPAALSISACRLTVR